MKQIEIRKPSVQSLFIKMRFNDKEISTGTGFIVESSVGHIFFTNRHNLTGRNNDTGKILSQKTAAIPNNILIGYNSKGESEEYLWIEENILEEDGTPLWFEHPTLKGKADFVALKLTKLPDGKIHSYDFRETGPDISCGPAGSVSVVGFPFGIKAGGLPIWVTGFIASEMDVDFEDLPLFLIDCRCRKGLSGSPVIVHASNGLVNMKDSSVLHFKAPITKFLGIYSGRVNEESDLGKVWKASALLELVESIENL